MTEPIKPAPCDLRDQTVARQAAEVARLEGLIVTVRCHEGYAKSCQCPDVELHAEARAIKARQK